MVWFKWCSKSMGRNLFTLPETNIAIENLAFWWYLQGKMGFSGAMLVSGRVSFQKFPRHQVPQVGHQVGDAGPAAEAA